ncbi:hypothetical protein OG218_00990 [Kineococcus sp. NBC_00420]
MALFARLAERLADQLGFEEFDHERLRAEVDTILSTRLDLAAS